MGEVNMTSFDDLFGDVVKETIAKETQKPIEQINVRSLHPFVDHPFKIKMNENFEALKASIENYGIMEPIIARPRKNDIGLEIISGHRRWTAAKQLKLETVPVIVVEVDDDLATIMMVEGNNKRDQLDPSEMAFAFKKLVEAEKRYSKKGDGGRVTERIGTLFGIKSRTVSNYIKLAQLIPQLIELVDAKVLKFVPATLIAELSEDMQELVLSYYNNYGKFPNKDKAIKLKAKESFNESELNDIMNDRQEVKTKSAYQKYDRYFPSDWTDDQKEEGLLEALEMWQKSKFGVQI